MDRQFWGTMWCLFAVLGSVVIFAVILFGPTDSEDFP